MSTLQATNLKHASSASNNLVLDANGNVTAAGTIAMATPFAMRNKIINGAMEIYQRATGTVTLTSSAQYTLDRWASTENTDGTMTVRQTTNAPSGFINAMYFETGTADSSLAATQYAATNQIIEGFNIADLAWGTASAKTVTLSFWVRSSLTGTFGGSIRNGSLNRSYPFTYTISAANTYEYKTVTIPGDTTGTWATDNTSGLVVTFGLGVGSAFSGTANTWQAGNFLAPTGAVSVIGTASANFYLTGVQLEVGSTATPFERRQYGQELALCQRYYFKTYSQTVAPGSVNDNGRITVDTNGRLGTANRYTITYPYMRASPTITVYNPLTGGSGTVRGDNSTNYSVGVYVPGESASLIDFIPQSPTTAVFFHFTSSAEL